MDIDCGAALSNLGGYALLTEEQWSCWDENGYVIIPRAVPDAHLSATIAAVAAFLDLDPDDPDTWYADPPRRLGFVEMYHHQAMWDNRQHPRVYEAFKDLWNEERLWVSIDRANMTPPERADRPHGFNESLVHWDFDTSAHPEALGMQGVLYLTDTAENQGGFQCVPGFHRDFFEWVKTQPAGRDPMRPDMTDLEPVAIPGKAGDLLIWHSLLPHGNSRNTSDKPRWCQYISASPSREEDESLRQYRISLWRDRTHPDAFPGDPRGVERSTGPARLTALGRRLLGLDRWE